MRFLIPLFLFAIGSARADQFGWFSQMLSAQQPRIQSNVFSGPNSFDPSVGLISPSFLGEPSAVQFRQSQQQMPVQPMQTQRMQQQQQQQFPTGFSNMQQMPQQQQQQQFPTGFSNMQQMPQQQQQQMPVQVARDSSVVSPNPCTEDVLRLPEVKQFKDPNDRQGFLVCVDVNVFREMKCSVGTFFNEELNHCVPEGFEAPKCPDGFCLNDGVCLVDEKNALRCSCKKGFSGERCAVNIDECALEGNAACSGGRCIDQVNGFYCQCPSGAIGLNCQQTIRNPCTSDNLQSGLNFFEIPSLEQNSYIQCTGPMQLEVRRCPDNLHWQQEEQTCSVDRTPLKAGICLTFPCKNGGECLESGNSAAGFSCACKPGYTGVMCEQMIDYCLSNPCQNDGKCLPYAGGYTCICKNKVIDECCCNGISNPCPPKSKIVPGVNNYFEHAFKQRYIHCDFDGRAFVRMCAPGTVWNQAVLTCTPEKTLIAMNNSSYGSGYGSSYGSGYQQPAPTSSYGGYGSAAPAPVQQAPSSSYGGYGTPAPAPVPAPVQQPIAQAPASSYGGYGSPAPAPVPTPVPAPVQQAPSSSYGGYGTPAPAPVPAPVQQPIAQAPSNSYGGYGSPAPAPVPTPVPAPVQQPIAQTPTSSYGGYGSPAPAPVPAPVQQPIAQAPSNSYGGYGSAAPAPVQDTQSYGGYPSSAISSSSSSSSSSDSFMSQPTIPSTQDVQQQPSNTFSTFQSSANTMPPQSNSFPSFQSSANTMPPQSNPFPSFQSSANTMPPQQQSSFGQQQSFNLNSFTQPPTGFFKSAQRPENTVNLMRRKILKHN